MKDEMRVSRDKPLFTKAHVIRLLEILLSEHRTQKKLAEYLGVTGQYVNDIMHGRRQPGDSILKPLGLEKIICYIERKK